MTVIVKHLPEIGFPDQPESWWMADVIFVEGGARNPKVPTLFQVADVDSGVVQWVNADLETRLLSAGLNGCKLGCRLQSRLSGAPWCID